MTIAKTMLLAAIALSVSSVAAISGDSQSRAVRKMLAAKQTAIPTGIDVPGPADYVLTERGVRTIPDPKDIKNPFVAQYFWAEREKRGAGSDGTSGQ
jgi:hypothetical protein